MIRKYAIYGTGGAARDVLGILHAQCVNNHTEAQIVFVDDDPARLGTEISGQPVISYEAARKEEYAFAIAISEAGTRQTLAQKIQKDGGAFFEIVSPDFIYYDSVTLAPGHIISDYVVITTNVTIGAHFHANTFSHIAHDCRIGDYVTFAPRVTCNGNVTIGDGAFIGSGAILRQGITIGARATVGMGAVVTKDVPDEAVVVGNPAKSKSAS